MKKSIKKLYKLGLLLIGVSLTLVNCQKDDSITETAIENKAIIKIKTFEELSNNPTFIRSMELYKGEIKKSKSNNDYEIDYTKIKEITYENNVSYTFAIYRDENTEGVFENLVIQNYASGSSETFILKYTTDELVYFNEHDSHSFKGNIEYIPLTEANMRTEVFCYTIAVCDYDYLHVAGPKCSNTWNETFCVTGGGGANSNFPPDGNPEGDSDSDPNSGIGGSTVNSPKPISSPVVTTINYYERITDCLSSSSSFTGEQELWLQHPYNFSHMRGIAGYLNDNCSEASQEFALLALEALDNDGIDDGEVDFENEIILDESFLTDEKLKCVYDKLKASNSNLFKATIGNFVNDPKLKIRIKKGNCVNTNDACCDDSEITTTGIVNLIIEDTTGSVLDIASSILHEGIHAEISRYVLLQAPYEDVNDRPRILELYKYYKDLYNEGDIEHIYMTEHYINPIASALRKLDSFSYPVDYYKSYAWDGLRKWDAGELLSMTENENYTDYKQIVEANTSLSCD